MTEEEYERVIRIYTKALERIARQPPWVSALSQCPSIAATALTAAK